MARTKGAKTGVVGNGIDKRLFELTMKKRAYTLKEVADMFSVSDETLRLWIASTYKKEGWTTFEQTKEHFRKQKGGLEDIAQEALINLAQRDFKALCALYDLIYKNKKPNEQIDSSEDAKNELETIVGKITLVTKKEVEESRQEEVSASND